MKLVKTTEAVGQVLCHDITQIIPGVKKDAVFRKGHIITEEDIPVLLNVGKDMIYIWENDETMLHENDAAEILYHMTAGENMHPSEVKEGKIEVIADSDGLLKVDRERLKKVNSFGELMIATRHGNTAVKKGDKLAGTRIIPLVIKKEKMEKASEICSDAPILKILPFTMKKAAVITTGNEVFYGRIKDGFTPVIEKKINEFGVEMAFHEAFNDDVMDDAAKTETEDKISENTGDGPKIPADESEHITDEQAEDECSARTHNEYRSVTDENQHIKQQTKPTHKKTYKKPHKKSHKKQFKDKSDKIKNCFYKLKREYSDERNKAAFLRMKKELFIILKRICPRRRKLTMVYSTGSPDTTGISLGILACFPVGYTNRWRITPDFESENPYAKGSFDIKGHVIVISILAATLRILFDKNCRRLYNRISR